MLTLIFLAALSLSQADGDLADRHLDVDLIPGTYNVTVDGRVIATGLVAGPTGAIGFDSMDHGLFAVVPFDAPPCADLVVQAIQMGPIECGAMLTMRIQVQNVGTSSAGATYTTAYVDGSAIAELYTAPLNAGSSGWTAWTAPRALPPPGHHEASGCCDTRHTVTEIHEDNNCGP